MIGPRRRKLKTPRPDPLERGGGSLDAPTGEVSMAEAIIVRDRPRGPSAALPAAKGTHEGVAGTVGCSARETHEPPA